MANITGSERRPPGGNDARDFDVAEVNRFPGCTPLRRATRRFIGRLVVEGEDSSLEIFVERAPECVLELPAAPSGRDQLQAEADLENRHRRGPDRFRRLEVEPLDDRRFGLASHQRRQNVGVEHNHFLKTAGRGLCPRSSATSA